MPGPRRAMHGRSHARSKPARRGCMLAARPCGKRQLQPATAATSMASLQNKLNSLSKSIDQHKEGAFGRKEKRKLLQRRWKVN